MAHRDGRRFDGQLSLSGHCDMKRFSAPNDLLQITRMPQGWPHSRTGDYRLSARATGSALLRLDARHLDHLGPLLGFLSNEFAEIGRRERKLSATFVGKPRLYFEVSESSVDFPVEPIDYLGG